MFKGREPTSQTHIGDKEKHLITRNVRPKEVMKNSPNRHRLYCVDQLSRHINTIKEVLQPDKSSSIPSPINLS